MNNDNTKVCNTCNLIKNKSEFRKLSRNKNGLANKCKQCVSIGDAIYRRNNHEKKKESAIKWYRANAEKSGETSRKWRENNPERVVERSHNYYLANKERHLEVASAWKKANREKVNEMRQRYRARKYENGEFYVREKFLKRLYASPCVNCGTTENISADHIIPITRGGVHSEGNLQPMCIPCNSSKNDKFMMEWKGRNKL